MLLFIKFLFFRNSKIKFVKSGKIQAYKVPFTKTSSLVILVRVNNCRRMYAVGGVRRKIFLTIGQIHRSVFYLKVLPVNGPKCVEVMHHYVMDVLESIQFPEGVEIPYTVLPHSRNLIEGLDSGAACWK